MSPTGVVESIPALIAGFGEDDGAVLLDQHGAVGEAGALRQRVADVGTRLSAGGVGPTDRVAVSLTDGPLLASVFLGVASHAVAAPLNPTYTEPEAASYLDDLEARVLVTDRVVGSGAVAAARARGIEVWKVAATGVVGFDVDGRSVGPAIDRDPVGPAPDDIALVLHTSGTTSRPKQVPLRHRQLTRSAHNVASTLGLTGSDRSVQVMPLFHIHGIVAGLLGSLAGGGSVVCTTGFDPRTFVEVVERTGATWCTAVPTIHQQILTLARTDRRLASSTLRLLRSSSSALPPAVMEELEDLLDVPVVESYGMTEAAHQMTSNPIPPGERRPGTVGLAAGPEVAVMGASGELLEPGSSGEVVIRGETVITGYHENPEADAAAFVDGWFRTGDQGVLDTDGYLRITGRLKEMIDRGGEKIAPREIDDALVEHAEVAAAVAFAVPHPTLGETVAAAVVPVDAGRFDVDAVLAFARGRLAPHKVPGQVVVVDEVPKGPTGKPTRIGLADRFGLAAAGDDAGLDGRTSGDALVTAVAGVLGTIVERPVPPDIGFVEVGGDSLGALSAASALADVFGVEIDPGSVLGGTATDLASQIRASRTAQDGGPAESRPGSQTDGHELAPAARRLWYLHRLEPGSRAHHVSIVLRVREGDERRVATAIETLVDRHDALRSHVSVDRGHPTRATSPRSTPFELRRADWSDDSAASPTLDARVASLVDEPLDLESPMPIRFVIARRDRDLVVVGVFHHAFVDGWSRSVLVEELAALLGGDDSQLSTPAPFLTPTPPIDAAADEAYWVDHLTPLPEPLELQPDTTGIGATAARLVHDLGHDARRDVAQLAEQADVSEFTVLLAAHAHVLRASTRGSDVVIGVASSTRGFSDRRVGMFVDTLPVVVRSPDPGATTGDHLRAVAESIHGALVHHATPFERLVELSGARRTHPDRPLVQTLFQLRPPAPDLEGRSLDVEVLGSPTVGAEFDLAVGVVAERSTLGLDIEFRSDRLTEALVRGLVCRFETVLSTMAAGGPHNEIDDVAVVPPAEASAIDRFTTGRAVGAHDLEPPLTRLHDLVADDPDAVTLVESGREITRADLAGRALALADHLERAGVDRGRVVAAVADRGVDQLTAWLATWMLGAVVAPFDPNLPENRLVDRLEALAPQVVVVRGGPLGRMRDVAPIADLGAVLQAAGPSRSVTRGEAGLDDDAWIIHTSGSTGEPKRIVGTHRGLANRLAWGRRAHPCRADEVALVRTSPGFVDALAETLAPVTEGAVAVVADPVAAADPRRLLELVADHHVTRLLVVPSLLAVLATSASSPCRGVRTVFSSGEPLVHDVVASARRVFPEARLVNVYGSTEVTADATAGVVEVDRLVTAGTPIDGVRVEIVDVGHAGAARRVPIGGIGDVWIAGAGVASNLPDAEVPAATVGGKPPERFVQTGDLGHWTSDGELRLVGRRDRQVEVNGVRVEPAEVEAVIEAHLPGVAAAVTEESGTLVGWLAAEAASVDLPALRAAVLADLPFPMVPNRWRSVDELPRTGSGKLDREALRVLAWTPLTSADALPVAGSDGWRDGPVATCWHALTGSAPATPHEDFFESGGDSLRAVELLVALEHELGIEVPVAAFIADPTVATLQRLVVAAEADAPALVSDRLLHLAGPVEAACRLVLFPGAPADPMSFRHVAPQLGTVAHVLHARYPGRRDDERQVVRFSSLVRDFADAVTPLSTDRRRLVLCGHSLGGMVAFDVAAELERRGSPAHLLVIGDIHGPAHRPRPQMSVVERLRYTRTRLKKWSRVVRSTEPGTPARRQLLTKTNLERLSYAWHTTSRVDATPTILLVSTERLREATVDPIEQWQPNVGSPIRTFLFDSTHDELFAGESADEIAHLLVDELG